MKSMTMGERLRSAREKKYKSASKAAEALGISASTYRAHENGQNDFGPEEAEQYARAFGANAGWLLTGLPWRDIPGDAHLRVIQSFDPDDEARSSSYSRETWTPSIPGAIPELHGKIGAGQGSAGDLMTLPIGNNLYTGHRVVSEWLLPEEFLRNEVKSSPRNAIVMEIVGDSMSPTYLPGDRAIIDLSQDKLSVDAVYVISDGHSQPQIKRLQRVPFSEPVRVRIISDNEIFETDTVDLERLTVIGRVVGHIARK